MIGLSSRTFFVTNDKTFSQVVRYTFSSALALIVDFGTLFLLTHYLSINYLVSAGLAFILGLLTNYLICIFWVFERRTVSNQYLELSVFAFIGVFGLGINELLIWLFTEQFHFHYLLSKLVSTGFVFIWNFSARKFLLFR